MKANTKHNVSGTMVICLLTACMEGYDLQSAGIVAPRLARHFLLAPDQLGWVFTAGTAGLFLGAIIGGKLSDRMGRKEGLITALLMFGLFSIGSGLVADFHWLVVMRLLTGLGLGSALPNLVALVAENGSSSQGAARVTKVTAFMPIGGALASILALTWPQLGWRGIFHVGGILPIILAVGAMRWLPASQPGEDRLIRRAPAALLKNDTKLLSANLRVPSIALWISSFSVLLILYVMLNWLPVLMEAKGAGASAALLAAMGFALAGALGGIGLGALLSRAPRLIILIGVHAGMFLSFLAVALAQGRIATLLAFSTTGFFIAGAQFLLYGVAGETYGPAARGTGVGAAVAAGRLGGIAGPALAAVILNAGASANMVILAMLPIVLLSLGAVILLGSYAGMTRRI